MPIAAAAADIATVAVAVAAQRSTHRTVGRVGRAAAVQRCHSPVTAVLVSAPAAVLIHHPLPKRIERVSSAGMWERGSGSILFSPFLTTVI